MIRFSHTTDSDVPALATSASAWAKMSELLSAFSDDMMHLPKSHRLAERLSAGRGTQNGLTITTTEMCTVSSMVSSLARPPFDPRQRQASEPSEVIELSLSSYSPLLPNDTSSRVST